MSAVIERLFDKKRRGAERRRGLPQARCVFKDGHVNVTFRTACESGVRIEGSGLDRLPERFELHIHSGFGEYAKRPVRLVWSRCNAAGLQFLDVGPSAA